MLKLARLLVVPALVVTVFAAQAVLAQGQATTPRRGFAGTVSSFNGSTLVVKVNGATSTQDVTFSVPTGATATNDISKGDHVAVLAEQTNGSWQAVYVVDEKTATPIQAHIGVVTSESTGSLKFVQTSGGSMNVDVPTNDVPPAQGELITLFTTQGPNGKQTKAGWQSAAQVTTRLERLLQSLTDNQGLTPEMQRDRDQLISRVADSLEQHAKLHAEQMKQVCDQVCNSSQYPSQMRDKIKQNLSLAQEGQQIAANRAQRARNGQSAGGNGTPSPTGSATPPMTGTLTPTSTP